MTSIVEHQRASGCFREKGREPDRQVEQSVLAKTRQMQKWWKYRWRGRPSPPSSRGQREPGQSRGTSSTLSPTIHHGEHGHEIESHRPGWPCPGRPRDPWRWVPFLLLWKGGIQHDSIFYSRSLLFQISQSWQVNCHSKYIGSQFHFQLNSLLANIFFYQVQFQFESNWESSDVTSVLLHLSCVPAEHWFWLWFLLKISNTRELLFDILILGIPPKKCAHPVELITPYKAAKKTLQSPNDGQMNKNLGVVVGDLDKQQWNCPSLSRAMFLPWSTGSILRYGPATAFGEEGKPWVSLPTTTWAAWQTCLHLQECHLENTWLHLSQWFDNKKRRSAIADGFIPFKRLGCIFIAHVDLDAKVFLTLRSSLLLTQP